jgi:hypothetical protein
MTAQTGGTAPPAREELMVIPALDRNDPTWREAQLEQRFWEKHQQEFRERYPDQFVAVADGQVVLASSDLQQLLVGLRNQGRDIHDVWVRYIYRDPSTMML